MLWRLSGFIFVAALPVWMALRHRLSLPVMGLLPTTGYVLEKELTQPGLTFKDVESVGPLFLLSFGGLFLLDAHGVELFTHGRPDTVTFVFT